MKRAVVKCLLFIALITIVINTQAKDNSCCSDTYGKTFWRGRSATHNSAEQLMGVANKLHVCYLGDDHYVVASISLGHEQSTNASAIGKNFAFTSCGDTIFGPDAALSTTNFTAGDVHANPETNVRNIDFGLSPSFRSVVTFNPTVEKTVMNLDVFMGLDQYVEDLWIRMRAPVVWASYAINPCEKKYNPGGNLYAPGFVSLSDDAVKVPYNSAVSAWQQLDEYGEVEGSGCGKIRCDTDTELKVGALQGQIGYDIIRCDNGHLSLGVYGSVGLSNAPRACNLFPVIAGSMNNELGAVFDGAWRVWHACEETAHFTLYGYAIMAHLFPRRQTRLLGLALGENQAVGNSWILLKQFDDRGAYTGKVINAANCLGRNISVGNQFMFDGSVMAQIARCAIDFSVGYNFYYISSDKQYRCQTDSTCIRGCYCNLGDFNYGIKGVARVGNLATPTTADPQIGDRLDSDIAETGTLRNAKDVVTNAIDAFVTEHDITVEPALSPAGWSHKVFFFVGYTSQCGETKPFVGVGGSYETASKNTLASQWAVYLKGGLSF